MRGLGPAHEYLHELQELATLRRGGAELLGEVDVGLSTLADPDSLLYLLAGLVRTRRECGELGNGDWRILDTGDPTVLGPRYDVGNSTVLVLNNLSPKRRSIQLELTDRERETATDLCTDRRYAPLANGNNRLHLAGLGYRWVRHGGDLLSSEVVSAANVLTTPPSSG